MYESFEISKRLQRYIIQFIKEAQKNEQTKSVTINTNLDCNVPEKDIHKIAGPFIDEWTYEVFKHAKIINNSPIKTVISKESSSLEDIFLTIEFEDKSYDVLIDVKSASLAKGTNAGKGSNLTSFRKIRPFYLRNPDAFFFILSVEHESIIKNNKCFGFNLVDCNIFDLKHVSQKELMLNTAMGDQFQISNSMNVSQVDRTTAEFIDLLDSMYVSKYSKEKLDKLIAEEEKLFHRGVIALKMYDIICEHQPISKKSILFYAREFFSEEEDSELEKAINLLKKDNKISCLNHRDYTIFQ